MRPTPCCCGFICPSASLARIMISGCGPSAVSKPCQPAKKVRPRNKFRQFKSRDRRQFFYFFSIPGEIRDPESLRRRLQTLSRALCKRFNLLRSPRVVLLLFARNVPLQKVPAFQQHFCTLEERLLNYRRLSARCVPRFVLSGPHFALQSGNEFPMTLQWMRY